MPAERLVLVVTLEVRRGAAAEFHSYETSAASIMATHGGRIERVIEVETDPESDTFRQVHIVSFPGSESFDAYRRDPRIASLAPLRHLAIAHTQILRGRDASLPPAFRYPPTVPG